MKRIFKFLGCIILQIFIIDEASINIDKLFGGKFRVGSFDAIEGPKAAIMMICWVVFLIWLFIWCIKKEIKIIRRPSSHHLENKIREDEMDTRKD